MLFDLCHAVAVGDEESDPALMEFLGAEMKKESGQFFKVGTKSEGEKKEKRQVFIVFRFGRRLCCPARCLTSWRSKDSRSSSKLPKFGQISWQPGFS